MNDITYFAVALILVIIALCIVKKIVGCFMKMTVIVILLAVLAIVYYLYFQ